MVKKYSKGKKRSYHKSKRRYNKSKRIYRKKRYSKKRYSKKRYSKKLRQRGGSSEVHAAELAGLSVKVLKRHAKALGATADQIDDLDDADDADDIKAAAVQLVLSLRAGLGGMQDSVNADLVRANAAKDDCEERINTLSMTNERVRQGLDERNARSRDKLQEVQERVGRRDSKIEDLRRKLKEGEAMFDEVQRELGDCRDHGERIGELQLAAAQRARQGRRSEHRADLSSSEARYGGSSRRSRGAGGTDSGQSAERRTVSTDPELRRAVGETLSRELERKRAMEAGVRRVADESDDSTLAAFHGGKRWGAKAEYNADQRRARRR